MSDTCDGAVPDRLTLASSSIINSLQSTTTRLFRRVVISEV